MKQIKVSFCNGQFFKKSVCGFSKLLYLPLMLATFLCIGLFSCEKQETGAVASKTLKAFEFSKDNVKIKYKGDIVDNVLSFNISLSTNNGEKSIDESFNIDISKPSFGQDVADEISEKSIKLASMFDKREIDAICSVFIDMVNHITVGLKIKEIKSLQVQGLFMSNSLFKATKRKLNNTSLNIRSVQGEFTNTVYEGFNREMSSFDLNEDIVLNIADFQSYIQSDPQNSLAKGGYVFSEILGTKSGTELTLQELMVDIEQYKNTHPANIDPVSLRWWPSGSSHGCCGNYSGPCYYWHPVCYVHDRMCSTCTPRWFCFDGCNPD